MTVHQRNCCILLYNFLNNNVSGNEISKKIIECAMDTIIKYNSIKDKQIKDDKEFFNDCLYSNELLLITLGYNLRQLVEKRKQEVIDFIELFNQYDESEKFKIMTYRKLPFRYANFDKEILIFNKYFNDKFDSYYLLLSKLYSISDYKDNKIFTNVYTFLNDNKVSFNRFIKDSNDNYNDSLCKNEWCHSNIRLYNNLKLDSIKILKKKG